MQLPSRLIPSWMREIETEHLWKVYGMLTTILERAGHLPNTPEKEEFVRLVEMKYLAAETVMLQAINSEPR